jgi:zinc resistance-associated protein
MKRTKLAVLMAALAVAAIMGFSAISYAWPGRHMGPPPGLTQEQHQQARQMRAEHFKAVNPLQQQLFAKQSELRALYYNDSKPSEAQVQGLIKEVAELQARIYAANSELQAQMSAQGIQRGWGHGGGSWDHKSRGWGHGGGPRGGCGF